MKQPCPSCFKKLLQYMPHWLLSILLSKVCMQMKVTKKRCKSAILQFAFKAQLYIRTSFQNIAVHHRNKFISLLWTQLANTQRLEFAHQAKQRIFDHIYEYEEQNAQQKAQTIASDIVTLIATFTVFFWDYFIKYEKYILCHLLTSTSNHSSTFLHQ